MSSIRGGINTYNMPEIQFTYQIEFNDETVTYLVSPKHRERGNPHKSIWIITPVEEFDCFCFTLQNDLVENDEAWGFLLDANDTIRVIGVGLNDEELKIAKFKKDPSAVVWHGYPCNYMANVYDVPSDTVLKKWVALNRISKAKMSKIQHNLSCSL